LGESKTTKTINLNYHVTYEILNIHEENNKVIKRYKRLGIIKNFGFETFDDYDDALNNYK